MANSEIDRTICSSSYCMCINLCCYCYCTLIIIAILLMVFGSLLQVTKTQNSVSFVVSRITVNEGTTASTVPVSIPLQRTAGSSGIATAFYMV